MYFSLETIEVCSLITVSSHPVCLVWIPVQSNVFSVGPMEMLHGVTALCWVRKTVVLTRSQVLGFPHKIRAGYSLLPSSRRQTLRGTDDRALVHKALVPENELSSLKPLGSAKVQLLCPNIQTVHFQLYVSPMKSSHRCASTWPIGGLQPHPLASRRDRKGRSKMMLPLFISF